MADEDRKYRARLAQRARDRWDLANVDLHAKHARDPLRRAFWSLVAEARRVIIQAALRCAVCGSPMTSGGPKHAKHTSAMTCSVRCRMRLYRTRHSTRRTQ